MKIILVQYRPAIRLYKWAVTLLEMGYDVTIGYTREVCDGLHWNRFNTIDINNITDFSEYDFYISFNPNVLIPYTDTVKVIQAVGDLKSLRNDKKIERDNLNSSYCNVFISDAQKEWAVDNLGVDEKKCFVLENGIIDELIGEKKRKLNNRKVNIVYSGTITDKEKHHRNIIDELKDIAKNKNIVLHIYPSYVSKLSNITESNIKIHKTVSPYELVSELSQYDYGLLIVADDIIGNMMLPNKVTDYLSAGLKILAKPYTQLKEFNEGKDCCIFFKEFKELKTLKKNA